MAEDQIQAIDGSPVKAWRTRNDYSQIELSMELDISRKTLSSMENSSKAVSRIFALSLFILDNRHECRNIKERKKELKNGLA